jgi:ribosomal protein S8
MDEKIEQARNAIKVLKERGFINTIRAAEFIEKKEFNRGMSYAENAIKLLTSVNLFEQLYFEKE